ncbi:MAG: class I SAM-dependent methyltransferase [Haliangiales bacterium]
MSERYLKDNLDLWDERVADHLDTELYAMDAFMKGASSLTDIEKDALGDVSGKSMLHLQCHFGQDSLSWVREGARVTGVDFAPSAIANARKLSEVLSLPARFIESDIYGLPRVLDDRFDIVFTSYGVLKWLPDIYRWGEVVSRFLKPGGMFFVVEFHPFLYVFDYETATKIEHTYFVGKDPISYDEVGTYANIGGANQKVRRAHSWPHPVSRVISSLLAAGLVLDSFEEFPYSTIDCFPFTKEVSPGRYMHSEYPGMVPMLYSVKAHKPTSNDENP